MILRNKLDRNKYPTTRRKIDDMITLFLTSLCPLSIRVCPTAFAMSCKPWGISSKKELGYVL